MSGAEKTSGGDEKKGARANGKTQVAQIIFACVELNE
jgi:hypothetical protein